jgi:hypothetical protein
LIVLSRRRVLSIIIPSGNPVSDCEGERVLVDVWLSVCACDAVKLREDDWVPDCDGVLDVVELSETDGVDVWLELCDGVAVTDGVTACVGEGVKVCDGVGVVTEERVPDTEGVCVRDAEAVCVRDWLLDAVCEGEVVTDCEGVGVSDCEPDWLCEGVGVVDAVEDCVGEEVVDEDWLGVEAGVPVCVWVALTLSDWLGVGVCDSLGVADCDWLGETFCEGVDVGDCVADSDWLADNDWVSDAVRLCVTEAVRDCDGVADVLEVPDCDWLDDSDCVGDALCDCVSVEACVAEAACDNVTVCDCDGDSLWLCDCVTCWLGVDDVDWLAVGCWEAETVCDNEAVIDSLWEGVGELLRVGVCESVAEWDWDGEPDWLDVNERVWDAVWDNEGVRVVDWLEDTDWLDVRVWDWLTVIAWVGVGVSVCDAVADSLEDLDCVTLLLAAWEREKDCVGVTVSDWLPECDWLLLPDEVDDCDGVSVSVGDAVWLRVDVTVWLELSSWDLEFVCDCVRDSNWLGVPEYVCVAERVADGVPESDWVMLGDWLGLADCVGAWDGESEAVDSCEDVADWLADIDVDWEGEGACVGVADGLHADLRATRRRPPYDTSVKNVTPASVDTTGATDSAKPLWGRPPLPWGSMSYHVTGEYANHASMWKREESVSIRKLAGKGIKTSFWGSADIVRTVTLAVARTAEGKKVALSNA